MKIVIDKSFEKDVEKIKDKKILSKIADCIELIQKTKKTEDIPNLKKLTGYKFEYRIKLNDYRIGLIISNNKIEFIRFLHRKDIYKFFPKN